VFRRFRPAKSAPVAARRSWRDAEAHPAVAELRPCFGARRRLRVAAARVLADEPTLRAEHLDLASDAEAARAYLAASKDRDALFRQDRRSRLRAADWPSQPIRRPVSTSPFRLAISSFTPAGGGKRSKPIAARFPIAAPKETACAR
jgi:hypothetical protein